LTYPHESLIQIIEATSSSLGDYDMDKIIKDIEAIKYDVREAIIASEYNMRDIDTGINTNHTREFEEVTKQQKIENLFYYLVEAKDGADSIKDKLKAIQESLDNLLDMVEYEAIVARLRSET